MKSFRLTFKTKPLAVLAAAALCAALSGCAGEGVAEAVTDAQAQSHTPAGATHTADFSTAGKPTMTLETPWGALEIYDPVQDPEIRAIFGKWYAENNKTYKKYRDENTAAVQTVRKAALIHELDYLKSKCEMRERVYHLAESPYYEKKYTGSRHVMLGTDKLSAHVNAALEDRDLGRPQWMVDKNIKYNPNWGVGDANKVEVGMLENGFIIGPDSYATLTGQMDVFFTINCRKWVGISDLSKGYENYFVNTRRNKGFTYLRENKYGPLEPDLRDVCEKQSAEIKLCEKFKSRD